MDTYVYVYPYICIYTHMYIDVCPKFPLNLNYLDGFPQRYNIRLSPNIQDLK